MTVDVDVVLPTCTPGFFPIMSFNTSHLPLETGFCPSESSLVKFFVMINLFWGKGWGLKMYVFCPCNLIMVQLFIQFWVDSYYMYIEVVKYDPVSLLLLGTLVKLYFLFRRLGFFLFSCF